MSFLLEVFWATAMVGVPIAVFSFVMVWWALKNGHFKESADTKALERELKAMSKQNKKDKKDKTKKSANMHPVLKKWGDFGGGFYGIVGLFTYVVIEIRELIDLVIDFGGFFEFLKQLNFGLIIEVFVSAITNFIAAIVWPLYWLDRIDTDQTWIWFVMAYAGYWAGMKAAQVLALRRSGAKT